MRVLRKYPHTTRIRSNPFVVLWQLHRQIEERAAGRLHDERKMAPAEKELGGSSSGFKLAWELPMFLFRAIRRMGVIRQGRSPGEPALNTGVVTFDLAWLAGDVQARTKACKVRSDA